MNDYVQGTGVEKPQTSRIEYLIPVRYRLAQKSGHNGPGVAYVLQGCYRWEQANEGGFEWRDIPMVYLNAAGMEIEAPSHYETHQT